MCKAHWLSSAADKFNAKLAPKYDGPYTISKVLSPVVYELERGVNESRKKTKAHVSQLKRFIPPRGELREPTDTIAASVGAVSNVFNKRTFLFQMDKRISTEVIEEGEIEEI